MAGKFFFAIASLLIFKSSLCQINSADNISIRIDTNKYSGFGLKRITGTSSPDRKLSTGIITGNISDGNKKAFSRVGTEITYKFSNSIAFVGNYLVKLSSQPFQERDYAAGIRLNTGKNNVNFFVETLLNLNIRKEMIDFNSSFSHGSIGVVVGAGSELRLFNNFSGILKTSLYKYNKPGASIGVFAGLKYRF